ncbi:hypothetical protein TNCV_2568181 [Trichonephila clavipes]|uniref:Uncharacterized protein n=1 Tax=Trichonephila clavipes TaxID=2585209 RepID=A0A8X7BLW6_TRICX|nr:hypothetical protein TNCV_2568181 [Trichonephila clavipes]
MSLWGVRRREVEIVNCCGDAARNYESTPFRDVESPASVCEIALVEDTTLRRRVNLFPCLDEWEGQTFQKQWVVMVRGVQKYKIYSAVPFWKLLDLDK